jgi:hypothetical protein
MDIIDIISKIWPLILAFITLVIVLSKMDLRIGIVEEKVKTLFDLFNKGK